jgi:hypothetical protein
MRFEPGFQGLEVQDEARDEGRLSIQFGELDDSLALSGTELVQHGEQASVGFGVAFQDVDHNNGAGSCHGVKGVNRAVDDLLKDLVSVAERCVAHHVP